MEIKHTDNVSGNFRSEKFQSCRISSDPVYRKVEIFRGRRRSRFDTKREFHRENLRGLLRYRDPADFQLLCGRGHKILQRKLSRMVLKPRETRTFSPSKVFAIRYLARIYMGISSSFNSHIFFSVGFCIFHWCAPSEAGLWPWSSSRK